MLPRCLILALLPALALAQKIDPVQWTLAAEPAAAAPGARVLLKFSAKIDKGWHLYSTTTATNPGPVQTKIGLAEGAPVELKQLYQPKPNVKRDEAFNNDQETYDDAAVFLLEAEVPATAAAGEMQITAQARYQVCSGTQCLRTKTKTAVATLKLDPGVRTAAPVIPAGYIAVQAKAPVAA
ncbi:MAG: hypothetical protein IT162_22215, partial [Bryobacterales bacterium]|nr:hypothetical protein [Bryobacterales bacterium]